jgi:hypothetical protein
LTGRSGAARRELAIHPAGRLAAAAGPLREARIGVFDPSGWTQKIQRASGAPYDDLSPQILRDIYDGAAVIVSGLESPAVLAAACESFDSRLRSGTTLILLNPAAGWQGWGIASMEERPPRPGPMRVAEGLARVVPAEDFGEGPWPRMAAGDAETVPLVSPVGEDSTAPPAGRPPAAARPGEGREPGGHGMESRRGPRGLVLAKTVGSGRVVVSVVPPSVPAGADALEIGVIEGLILEWLLSKPADGPRKKENRYE